MTPPSIRRVGIVGLGYVGRATAHALRSSVEVCFHDPAVEGSYPLAVVASSDLVYVCVPTPSGAAGAADLGIVREVLGELAQLGSDATVLLKSTVPPGTTDALAAAWPGLRLAFHPEFLREQHHLADAVRPSRNVLGWTPGVDEPSRRTLRLFYRARFPDIPCIELPAIEAELLKYASNALFGVKVSFANEMAELAHHLGANWESVREVLALDPRVGDGHLRVPGPDGRRGFGGHCLPKDMAALLATAASAGVPLPVVQSALEANHSRREDP